MCLLGLSIFFCTVYLFSFALLYPLIWFCFIFYTLYIHRLRRGMSVPVYLKRNKYSEMNWKSGIIEESQEAFD